MSLPLWEDCKWSKPNLPSEHLRGLLQDEVECPLPYSPHLAEKIYLYLGPCFKVPADALVVGQNESLTDRTDENEALLTLAGPAVEEELIDYSPIQTGESVCTGGGSLPVNNIIHAVGPRYDEKYITASNHALFSAYKSALLCAAEKSVADIVISCIYSRRKKFPRWEAAQIALRTIRKFLNHSIANSFRRIMFCVPTQEDFEIYSALLTAYFPRTVDEHRNAGNLLPQDLGDDWGELKIKERDLNLSVGPQPLREDEHAKYCAREQISHTNMDHSVFKTGNNKVEFMGGGPLNMTDIGSNTDEERKRKISEQLMTMSKEDRLRLKYSHLVQTVDLSDEFEDVPTLIQFIGKDRKNRDVILLDGYSCKSVDVDRALSYSIKIMEKYRCKPFIVLFTCPIDDDSVDYAIIGRIFELFIARYKENIDRLLIFNPSILLRMHILTSMPYVRSQFWNVYRCISSTIDLEKYIEVNELLIPVHKIIGTIST